ncbi:hypothetical protein GCM10008090_23170 [Arenicella chitinivorans]|uniref:Uncharacterized protein n=1 Tax=Arenicella chitinivorans TaxID=1329800 RepID=A0A918RVE4_9GAMM|nr:hypothetical protein GCM10008090_23170 [Arenicella chitinivorans]
MKSNLLTSILSGLIFPFFCFVFIDFAPMNIYENDVLVNEASQSTELLAFIEFYGVGNSLLIYSKIALVIFLFALLVCVLNQYIKSRIETEL